MFCLANLLFSITSHMTCSVQTHDVTRKHFVLLRCLVLSTHLSTGYLTADVPFDPILFSVPACDHLREWQEIRWLPVALVCAQVTDRPVIREACLIFHARESSERLLKAFPCEPPLSLATTPDRNLPENKKQKTFLLWLQLLKSKKRGSTFLVIIKSSELLM